MEHRPGDGDLGKIPGPVVFTVAQRRAAAARDHEAKVPDLAPLVVMVVPREQEVHARLLEQGHHDFREGFGRLVSFSRFAERRVVEEAEAPDGGFGLF